MPFGRDERVGGSPPPTTPASGGFGRDQRAGEPTRIRVQRRGGSAAGARPSGPAPRPQPPTPRSAPPPRRSGLSEIIPAGATGALKTLISTGTDVATSGLGLNGSGSSASNMLVPQVMRLFGFDAADARRATDALETNRRMSGQISGGDVVGALDQARLFFRPQTQTGRNAETVGSFLPAAFLPGSMLQRAGYVAAPLIGRAAGDTAADIGGFDQEGRAAAELAGTVGGGIAAGLNPVARLNLGGARAATIDIPRATAQALDSLPQGARNLPAPAIEQLQADLRAGVRPEDAAVRAVNSTLSEPVPMSRGQTSGLPDQQAVENAMKAGGMGRTPAEIARAQATDAQGAITANLNQVGESVVGGPVPPRGAGAASASENLNAMYDRQRTATMDAYDAARNQPQASAMFPAAEKEMLNSNLRGALSGFREQRVPAVFAEINRLQGLKEITPADLFDVREALTNLRNSGDGTEAAAAGRAVKALDGEIVRMEPMMQGDITSIDLWRQAIAQRRQQGALFEGNDAVAGLTERALRSGEPQRVVAPEDAGNRLFGTGNSWVNKPNLARDLARMREVLGPGSEGWTAVRGEHFRRLMDAGRGPLEGGIETFSGRNFANAWRDARRNAMPALKELYTADEIAALDRLAFIADRATSPVTGGRNYSNSATTLKILTSGKLGEALKVIPGVKALIEVIGNAQRANEARAAFVHPKPNKGGSPKASRPPLIETGPSLLDRALARTYPALGGPTNTGG